MTLRRRLHEEKGQGLISGLILLAGVLLPLLFLVPLFARLEQGRLVAEQAARDAARAAVEAPNANAAQTAAADALARARAQTGEPTFARLAELLSAKESPYLDFLRQQAAQARAEQNRYLERAADRAYLAMHAPVAPLLAVLVLLLAYGFLRFLAQTV